MLPLMPQGFAFVYFKRKEDGDYAVRKLDGMEWGNRRPRPLRLEWAKVHSCMLLPADHDQM